MGAAELIQQALDVRDKSLAAIEPPLDLACLPTPLPKNVTHLAKDVLSEEELEITGLDALELLDAIRVKKYTCVAVAKAFLRRAALAQELLNCTTELLPEMALQRAAYLDSLGHPLGPLHGLPISIKEHHGMVNGTNHASFVARIKSPQPSPSGVNDVLWEAGAVFYVRTTQPQCIMHLETSSNIYGTTLNPHNLDLTPGGSSGGESALISFRGSVLGVGGDIGGSIRCPAANCGIYGIKPTPGRLSRHGASAGVKGQDGIAGTHGPMSTTRSGIELFMETYISYSPWIKDTGLVPLPWRQVTLQPRLKIAFMWSDDIVTPHPPVTRALKEVYTALQQYPDRFELVDWKPSGHDTCWDITQALYYEDGGRAVRKEITEAGETVMPLTEWLLTDGGNIKYRTVEEVWDLKVRRNAYRDFYNDLWLSTGSEDGHPVDAILSPVGPGPAPPHGNAKYWSYTSQWNMLEYAAVAFPVTTVDVKLDVKDTNYVPKNEKDKFNWDLYEPEAYVNAPVGLQIITRRWEDEKCLAILKEVERAMGRE
ncbi:acetamidase [Bisporella sp. PMI_857]|nr:acetamidase [Bisporella sp. PMI_857]